MKRFELPIAFYYGPGWQHLDCPPTLEQVAASQVRRIIPAKPMGDYLIVEGYPQSRQVTAPQWDGGPAGDGPCWFRADREQAFRAIVAAA